MIAQKLRVDVGTGTVRLPVHSRRFTQRGKGQGQPVRVEIRPA